ncbi:MAG: CPBP family intramembrane metalloprotease [Planctomycetes bacterium]|nr:CPBP family intramembrane metalloprotease [Planctomycetota bacterium]
MFDFNNILAQAELALQIHVMDIITLGVCFFGLLGFFAWLSGSLGSPDLSASPPRRNSIPLFMPVIYAGIWILLSAFAATLSFKAGEGLSEVNRQFLGYLAIAIIDIGLIVSLLAFAYVHFARRLKGLGLNPKTIIKDIPAAAINYVCVLPLVIAAVLIVTYVGGLFNFELQTNEGLSVILDFPQLHFRILMLFFTVIVAPVFEELLFRGFFQSMLRGYTKKPWTAIFITSAIFATLHPLTHWPALFIFSCCMGYAYEKSGSLFRSIIIHAIFNGINVAAAIMTTPAQ